MYDGYSLTRQLEGEAYTVVGNGNSRWFQQVVRFHAGDEADPRRVGDRLVGTDAI